MALNKEVWINQIMEGFYPDDSFLQKAKDFPALWKMTVCTLQARE